jgi:hypothetical protein
MKPWYAWYLPKSFRLKKGQSPEDGSGPRNLPSEDVAEEHGPVSITHLSVRGDKSAACVRPSSPLDPGEPGQIR